MLTLCEIVDVVNCVLMGLLVTAATVFIGVLVHGGHG
jgi:hypothetical protein